MSLHVSAPQLPSFSSPPTPSLTPQNLPKTLALHYTRILRLWPQDALRGITFHDATRRRLTARILLPALPPQTSVITNETTATGTGTTPKPLDEKDEMEQVNALYSLLENRYSDTVSGVGAQQRYACVQWGKAESD